LNDDYFKKARPTDVISFAYDPVPGEQRRSGEVIVNVQRAHQEGRRREGVDEELGLYIAHGCHHLAGARDDTPRLRARMLRREKRWLRAAADFGGLAGLTRAETAS
jgi:rRNA maturation RNase YbeY